MIFKTNNKIVIKSRLISLSLFSILLSACLGKLMDSSIDLGSGYKYIQEPNQLSIIYQIYSDANGSGPYVIPPKVEEYSFNKRFIIAKSRDIEELDNNKEIGYSYWIIDKSDLPMMDNCTDAESCSSELMSNVTKFEDSLMFKEALNKRGISLSFESWQ